MATDSRASSSLLEAPAAGCGPLKALAGFRPFFWLHFQRETRLCDPLLCEALTSQLNGFDKVTVPNGSEKARHQPMSDEITCDVQIARSFRDFMRLVFSFLRS